MSWQNIRSLDRDTAVTWAFNLYMGVVAICTSPFLGTHFEFNRNLYLEIIFAIVAAICATGSALLGGFIAKHMIRASQFGLIASLIAGLFFLISVSACAMGIMFLVMNGSTYSSGMVAFTLFLSIGYFVISIFYLFGFIFFASLIASVIFNAIVLLIFTNREIAYRHQWW
jgi:hypothetical protein